MVTTSWRLIFIPTHPGHHSYYLYTSFSSAWRAYVTLFARWIHPSRVPLCHVTDSHHTNSKP
ncbi:hypothetical protein GBA52_025814 [Prunus armeniaca]|nr:hypothetical protein GBA52_025814 [Prunus armeniaca]